MATSSNYLENFKRRFKQFLIENKGQDAHVLVTSTFDSVTDIYQAANVDRAIFDILVELLFPPDSGIVYPTLSPTEQNLVGVVPYARNYRSDPEKNNFLHFAVKSTLLGVVQYLIAHHRDLIEEPNNENDTPLHFAVALNLSETDVQHLSVVSYVMEKATSSAYSRTNLNRTTPLAVSQEFGSPEVFVGLLQKYSSTSLRVESFPFGDSLFHFAARNDNHAVHALRALIPMSVPAWKGDESRELHKFHGHLNLENIRGETARSILTSKNVPIHEILKLENEEININVQRDNIPKFEKERDEELMKKYILAVSISDYVTIYKILSELAEQNDARLYMLITSKYNIFTLLSEHRSASPELVGLFANIQGIAFQLFNFYETPLSVNREVVTEIYNLRSGEDESINVAFHGLLNKEESEIVHERAPSVHSLGELIDYLGTDASREVFAEDSDLRTKVSTYERTTQVAESSTGRSVINVASHSDSGITHKNFVDVFSTDEKDKQIYEKMKRFGVQDDLQFQRFVESPKGSKMIQGENQSSVYAAVEHMRNMKESPDVHSSIVVETIKNHIFDLNRIREERLREVLEDRQNGFVQQCKTFINMVNKRDFAGAFFCITLSPTLIEFHVDSEGNNVYHKIAELGLDITALLEFFNLAHSVNALRSQNSSGQSPLDVAKSSGRVQIHRAMEYFLEQGMNNVRVSYALDNGASLVVQSQQSIDIRSVIAKTAFPSKIIEESMNFTFECVLLGKTDIDYGQVATEKEEAEIAESSDEIEEPPESLESRALNDIASGDFTDYEKLIEENGAAVVFSLLNEDGENAAHIAAKSLNSDAIKALARLGFTDFNRLSAKSERPLNIANRVLTKETSSKFKAFHRAIRRAMQQSRK